MTFNPDTIRLAFKHIYTTMTNDQIVISEDADHIDVVLDHDGQDHYRPALPVDGYLNFYPYDADYAEEFPDEDPLDFLSIRIKAY